MILRGCCALFIYRWFYRGYANLTGATPGVAAVLDKEEGKCGLYVHKKLSGMCCATM